MSDYLTTKFKLATDKPYLTGRKLRAKEFVVYKIGAGFLEAEITWKPTQECSSIRELVNQALGYRVGLADLHVLLQGVPANPLQPNQLELIEFVEEITNWSCECELPEEGESGVVECWACRAKKLLRKTRGEKGG